MTDMNKKAWDGLRGIPEQQSGLTGSWDFLSLQQQVPDNKLVIALSKGHCRHRDLVTY